MKKIKIDKSVVYKTVKDIVVLHNTSTGGIFSLNEVGSFIWEKLEKGIHKDDIFEVLKSEFPGVKCTNLSVDLESFLKDLIDNKIISYL